MSRNCVNRRPPVESYFAAFHMNLEVKLDHCRAMKVCHRRVVKCVSQEVVYKQIRVPFLFLLTCHAVFIVKKIRLLQECLLVLVAKPALNSSCRPSFRLLCPHNLLLAFSFR